MNLCQLLRDEMRPFVEKALAESHSPTCTSYRLVTHQEKSERPEHCLRSCGTTARVLHARGVLVEIDAFLAKYEGEGPITHTTPAPHRLAEVQYTAPEILCGETSYYGGALVSCTKTRDPHKWHITVVSTLQDAMVNRVRWQSGDAAATPIADDVKRSRR